MIKKSAFLKWIAVYLAGALIAKALEHIEDLRVFLRKKSKETKTPFDDNMVDDIVDFVEELLRELSEKL